MAMDIIIGRDQNTSQLRLMVGQQGKLFGAAGSVPMSVSRQHCSITVGDDGSFTIKNLKLQNTTYVNGIAVESKKVTERDSIMLGGEKYVLDWSAIKSVIPKFADIRPLEKIWNDNHDAKLEYQVAQGKFNALRSATGIISMLAIVCSFVLGHSPVYLTIYAFAIIITVFFTVNAYKKAAKGPYYMDELDKDFKSKYVCPNCHHFLGYNPYDVLKQNDACPYCRAKYRK
jgi:hypothetical protein